MLELIKHRGAGKSFLLGGLVDSRELSVVAGKDEAMRGYGVISRLWPQGNRVSPGERNDTRERPALCRHGE